jgi:hypothetical protein
MAVPTGYRNSAKHATYGDWGTCVVRVYGGDGADDADFYAGHVDDGELAIEVEYAEVKSGTPEIVEHVFAVSAGMMFKGGFAEGGSVQVMGFLAGRSIAEVEPLIPIGALCGGRDEFGVFLQRKPCGDEESRIEAWMHRVHMGGNITMGSSRTEATTFEGEMRALSDANGRFGGTPEMPLGSLYTPFKGVNMVMEELVHRSGIDPDPGP